MPGKYVIAIDQGTTGTTVLVLDRRLQVLAKVNEEFRQQFPKPGHVEHDLEDILKSVTSTIGKALRTAGIKPGESGAMGTTNQRETPGLWPRGTGKPVANAIVGQDRRTAAACAALKDRGLEKLFRDKT